MVIDGLPLLAPSITHQSCAPDAPSRAGRRPRRERPLLFSLLENSGRTDDGTRSGVATMPAESSASCDAPGQVFASTRRIAAASACRSASSSWPSTPPVPQPSPCGTATPRPLSIARVYRPVVARVNEPPCGPVDGLLSPLGLRVNHHLSVEQGPVGRQVSRVKHSCRSGVNQFCRFTSLS